MIKLNDKFPLGFWSGIIANLIRNIFNYICYYLNLTEYIPRQIAAASFIPATKVNSPVGIIIGLFSDYGVAIFFGLTIVYLLDYSGNDHKILKGLSVSLLYWLLLFGMMLRFGLSRIEPTDLATNLVFLINHILLGVLVIGLINNYGPNDLK